MAMPTRWQYTHRTAMDTYLSLSVLDGQLDSDSQPLPVTGSLGNVITNFLGRLKKGNAT